MKPYTLSIFFLSLLLGGCKSDGVTSVPDTVKPDTLMLANFEKAPDKEGVFDISSFKSYTDAMNKGASTASYSLKKELTTSLRYEYSLNQASYPWSAFCNLELNASSKPVDYSKYKAVVFRHRGDGVLFTGESKAVTDYAWHQKNIPASSEWQEIAVSFASDLIQPDWAEKPAAFSAADLQAFSWRFSGRTGEKGWFEIDDVRLITQEPVKDTHTVKDTSKIRFSAGSYDLHEDYLTRFDSLGVQVMLGVESGDADLIQLMDLIMKRYGHHKSVIGYCIDIEWVTKNAPQEGFGRPIDDSTAKALDTHLKTAYGRSDLKLILKHWDTNWLPKTYRSDMIFLNDGQRFKSFAEMTSYMKSWYSTFNTNTILFQIGYPADYPWWKTLSNPIKTIGDTLSSYRNPGQKTGVLWVDFMVNAPEVRLLNYNPADSTAKPAVPLARTDFPTPDSTASTVYAGIRCSSYGGFQSDETPCFPYQFPSVTGDQWNFAARNMVKQFPGSQALMLWAVGSIDLSTKECMLEFPKGK